MNQNEFFNILMDGLKDFPESKLRDIIFYYDNKFNHGLALGKTEEEIVTELGNPNLIVNQYRNEFLDTVDNPELFTTDSYKTFTNTDNLNDEKLKYDFSFDNDVYTNTNDDDNYNDTNFTMVNDSIISNSNDNINTINIIDSNNIISNNIIDTSSIDSSKLITDNETLLTVDVSDDTLNNEEITLNIDNTLDDIQNNTPPYEDNNSNNNFYNLYTSNLSTESKDANYENSTSNNSNYKKPQSTVNIILKVCIVCVTLLIFSPVITGIITCIIGILGVAISILVGSIGLLVGGTFTSLVGVPNLPMFVANFPYPVIVLFSLGSISLSLLLTLVFYYLCKFFIILLIKAYRVLKLKGGDL